jgi:hypothetical protein
MPPLGEVGDDDPPPQAEISVASVAPEAAWHAPAQNRRREIVVFVSDMAEMCVRAAVARRPEGGKIEATRKKRVFCESAVTGDSPPITDWGCGGVIS